MQFADSSSTTIFLTPFPKTRGPKKRAVVSVAPVAPAPLPIEVLKHSPVICRGEVDRQVIRVSLLGITAMLDIVCIAWVFVAASQFAEYAGTSFLDADYIGLGATALSIPLVIAGSVMIWRRLARRNAI